MTLAAGTRVLVHYTGTLDDGTQFDSYLGIVRERSEKALNTYVRRITGCGLDKATTKQCQLVIETLKKWLDRIPDIEIQKQCLVVLRGADSAPQTIGSSVVTEAQYGHPQ